jgi:hypothetical protein
VHGGHAADGAVPGRRSVVIPINWRSHSAKLVVALK